VNRAAPEIVPARSAAELDEVRLLFREYAAEVGDCRCFAGFEAELAGLPGEYASPAGALLLARAPGGAAAAGCVALRPIAPGEAEMKRLYVRPASRGTGLGRALALEAIAAAHRAAHRTLLLDTLPAMAEAIALYRSLGFRSRGPYSPRPTPGAIFFELSLS
jgi:ribosomal protein S18 acetylase RimI-like enzyme